MPSIYTWRSLHATRPVPLRLFPLASPVLSRQRLHRTALSLEPPPRRLRSSTAPPQAPDFAAASTRAPPTPETLEAGPRVQPHRSSTAPSPSSECAATDTENTIIRYGVSPFKYAIGESGGSLQLAIVNAQLKWLAGPSPPYPNALHQFVTWMLQPQPAMRPHINDIVLLVDKLMEKYSS